MQRSGARKFIAYLYFFHGPRRGSRDLEYRRNCGGIGVYPFKSKRRLGTFRSSIHVIHGKPTMRNGTKSQIASGRYRYRELRNRKTGAIKARIAWGAKPYAPS